MHKLHSGLSLVETKIAVLLMTKSFITTALQKHSLIKSGSHPTYTQASYYCGVSIGNKNQLIRSLEITGRAMADDVFSALNVVDYNDSSLDFWN